MDLTCISDLHGYHPLLESGDLLIVAGDLTGRDTETEYLRFREWLSQLNYTKIVLIGGNHDNFLESNPNYHFGNNVEYLCDSGTTFEGLKIWGTPWTPWFHGVNPSCKAFMLKEKQLKAKFDLIPDDIDILISHGPPKGCLDGVERGETIEHVGSQNLLEAVERAKPPLHIFGHIHEHGGKQMVYKWMMERKPDCRMFNCSYVDERYRPVNKPVKIEIAHPKGQLSFNSSTD